MRWRGHRGWRHFFNVRRGGHRRGSGLYLRLRRELSFSRGRSDGRGRGLGRRGGLGVSLRSTRTGRTGRRWGFILFHEVLGKDAFSFGTRLVGILAEIPFRIFLLGDGNYLTDSKVKVIIVARRILEDRSDRERRAGHLVRRGGSCHGDVAQKGATAWGWSTTEHQNKNTVGKHRLMTD